jgi:predicted MPP superfamily phosphohydrolase
MSDGYYSRDRLRRVIGIRPGRTQLYVNRGLGISGLALRFLTRPELTIITLRRGLPQIRRVS